MTSLLLEIATIDNVIAFYLRNNKIPSANSHCFTGSISTNIPLSFINLYTVCICKTQSTNRGQKYNFFS